MRERTMRQESIVDLILGNPTSAASISKMAVCLYVCMYVCMYVCIHEGYLHESILRSSALASTRGTGGDGVA